MSITIPLFYDFKIITKYKFHILSPDDIIKNSVLQIQSKEDLYSNILGATKIEKCKTCYQPLSKCCGHLGYIQLNEYYPIPIKQSELEQKLKHYCILHKQYEPQPHEYIQCLRFDKKVNTDIIKYFVCPLYCIDNDSAYTRDQLYSTFVALNPKYVQQLLQQTDTDIFFSNVVPVPCLTTRQTLAIQGLQTTNSTNIYNQIYEIILQYSQVKVDWLKGKYIIFNSVENDYCKLLVATRLIMFNDSAKGPKQQHKNQMLKFIGKIQNINDVCSLCAAAITKYGLFRQAINSMRVFKSTRTVITGDAYLQSDQVVIPLDMAQEITVAIKVNSINYQQCLNYINNFPNYPCCHKVLFNTNQQLYTMTDFTKQNIFNKLQPGDIIYRQVINNDICLVNRYPSIREESFGSHKVIVKNIKTIQFNLQVVKKMTADFDGDEMQLYFMVSPDNNLEISLLSSMQRQLITYENGFNLIGGSPDLDAGIFLAKQLHKEKELSDIIKKYIPDLSYKNKDIEINNSNIIQFSKQLADKDSQFLTWLQTEYGQTITLQIIDDITRYIYTLIQNNGSTIYSTIFKEYPKEYKELTYLSIDSANKLNEYYLSQDVYNEQLHQLTINTELQKHSLQQVEQIKPLLTINNTFFNKLIDKFQEQLRSGIICIGQAYNENNDRITHPIRTLPCYPKFSPKVQYQGFITDNFISGLSQTSLFLDSISGRKQLYNKGNAVEKDGYTARRLAKGANNAIAGFNGIVFSDSQTIISFQYGQYSYDCRCFQKISLNIKDIKLTPRRQEIINYFKKIEYQLSLDNPKCIYNPDIIKFHLPFIPNQKVIGENELELLLSCRLTENMTQEFITIIYQQVFYFYAYCILTMDIIPYQKSKIVQEYIQSLVSPGEMVGLKASHASTQPYTQSTLHSIHHTIRGKTEIEIEKLTGSARFMELLTNTKGPISVEFQLLPGYDIQQFIKQYQHHTINQLQPIYDVYYTNNTYILEINLSVKILGMYNILFVNLLYTLQQNDLQIYNLQYTYPNIKITCTQSKNDYLKIMSFINSTTEIINQQNISIRNLKLKKNSNILEGNINENQLQQIYKIREIDSYSIYCNNPTETQNLFGIERCNQLLHLELYHNLTTDESTKEVQGVHVKLLSDILTQTGYYKNFTSASYKGQGQKDIIQLMLFEYSIMFIQHYLENELEYSTDTIMNSQLFGNTPSAGTSYCEYYTQNYLYQQDVQKIYNEINQ